MAFGQPQDACNRLVTPVWNTGLVRIDRTMIGFAVINGFTFFVDIAVLAMTHQWLHWPVPVAATAGYCTALTISFVLNRTFNFQVHGQLGSQAGKFAVAVFANYLVFVLGFVSLLVSLGVDYRLARLTAGCVEGIFLYCVMRFAVFRQRKQVNPADTAVNPETTHAA